jgi:dipeptidyl aminopeptidase/acylaminoacyl peptidase
VRPRTAQLDIPTRVASPWLMSKHRSHKRLVILAGLAAGVAAYIAAHRFAVKYRDMAGLPHPSPVESNPADFGLPFEEVVIASDDAELTAWLIPTVPAPRRRRTKAAAGAETGDGAPAVDRRPGIVIVHGWESNRGRSLAHARYLHAAGFVCLLIDARGHGGNPPEMLPVNVPEFADDAAAAARWLAARPEVSVVGMLGHSMGGSAVIVAASREPLVGAVASVSAPADLIRMTRKTFEMAGMRIPDPIAWPLATITATVLLAPRRRTLAEASAVIAAGRYRGPLLLVHGAGDRGVPVEHLELIARSAADAREEHAPPVETLVLPEFGHRWLYESPEFRRRVAHFFADALGGLVRPDAAADAAAACEVVRPAEPDNGFGALPNPILPA